MEGGSTRRGHEYRVTDGDKATLAHECPSRELEMSWLIEKECHCFLLLGIIQYETMRYIMERIKKIVIWGKQ